MRAVLLHLALLASLGTTACTGMIDDTEIGGGDSGRGGGPGGAFAPDAGAPSSPPDAAKPPPHVNITGPAVLAHVQKFADAMCATTSACSIGTRAGHQPVAERAIDILVSSGFGSFPASNALGERVAQYALDHSTEFKVTYVIWRQRYNDGSGWDPMADRGSITENHYDHVHISFNP